MRIPALSQVRQLCNRHDFTQWKLMSPSPIANFLRGSKWKNARAKVVNVVPSPAWGFGKMNEQVGLQRNSVRNIYLYRLRFASNPGMHSQSSLNKGRYAKRAPHARSPPSFRSRLHPGVGRRRRKRMYHPHFAPTWMKHEAMGSLKAQQPSFYIVDARRNLLCQLLVGRRMTFLNKGRNDMVVK